MTDFGASCFGELRRRVDALPAEMLLLMLLARGRLDPDASNRVRKALEEEPDWTELLGLTRRHRLQPLVARHLAGFGDLVPEDVARQLAAARRTAAALMLKRTAQLIEVADAFRQCGIPMVPYKGPALAVQLYGEIATRPAGDLDLLVRPADAAHARLVLESLGYRARFEPTPEQWEFMLRNRCQKEFVRADAGWVELHWAFTNRDFPFALDLDATLTRLGTVCVGGRPLPAFHPDDLLPILCVHGAKHRWDHLEWLAGVAQLLRLTPSFDWDAILERARTMGVRRTLCLGVGLAVELLEAPAPAPAMALVRDDPEVGRLAVEVLDLVLRPPEEWDPGETMRRDRFRVRLRERRRDRLGGLWHRITTPSDPERWEVVRLAGRPFPVHALRRPFRIARRAGLAARSFLAL